MSTYGQQFFRGSSVRFSIKLFEISSGSTCIGCIIIVTLTLFVVIVSLTDATVVHVIVVVALEMYSICSLARGKFIENLPPSKYSPPVNINKAVNIHCNISNSESITIRQTEMEIQHVNRYWYSHMCLEIFACIMYIHCVVTMMIQPKHVDPGDYL